jgi:hypothetical protein
MSEDKKSRSEKPTFASVREFEVKMFPRAVASRSLRADGAASKALGERLAEALAQSAERRLPPSGGKRLTRHITGAGAGQNRASFIAATAARDTPRTSPNPGR